MVRQSENKTEVLQRGQNTSPSKLGNNKWRQDKSVDQRREEKHFVSSGSRQIQEQLIKLITNCGGSYTDIFDRNTTHVIMETEEKSSRMCLRTMKYFMGIAHHCWVLGYKYIEESLKAGYYLPEDKYEIQGDTDFPTSFAPSISRQSLKPILQGVQLRFTGECKDFPKVIAADIIMALGGELGGEDSLTVTLDETGECNTVSRDWLFDTLSVYKCLDTDKYIHLDLSDAGDLVKGNLAVDCLNAESCFEERSSTDNSSTGESFIEDSVDDEDYIPSEESDNDSIVIPLQYNNTTNTISPVAESESDINSAYENRDESNVETENEKDSNAAYENSDASNTETENEKDSNAAYENRDESNVETENDSNAAYENSDASDVETEISKNVSVNEHREIIYVAKSKKSEDGKRVWDKQHSCVYCTKRYSKLARHLEQVHSTELDVQRALAYDKKSKKRKSVWRDIMNRGDFAHNSIVFERQKGEIIPYKRSYAVRDGTKYVQCDTCLGAFLGTDLWRHVKNCHPHNKGKTSNVKKYHQVASAELLPVSSAAVGRFREIILNRMANDSVSLIVRNDFDIVSFGQRMFQKHAKNTHQYQYIRQKMRELARFLEFIRAIDSTVVRLRDCIDSLKFEVCLKAVRGLCGYNEDDMIYSTPSLANKLGHSLHKLARQVKIEASKNGDKDLKEKAMNFIEVYKEDWETEVSHAAMQTLAIQKYNKATRIPLAEDLKVLTAHLKSQAVILTEIFESSKATDIEWREMCEITLAQLVLFNKKRAGEAERLEVQQYLDGIQHGKNMQEEFLLSLSPLEKKLCEVIDRVEIRGKRGRRVAILLPQNLRRQLDILMKNRSVGGIDTDNKYVFARPGDAEFPLRATDVLRKFASECGAKQPELLTSTSFRKHVAVISQMLNLKENELDVLAGFLGHDIRIHREFYRLPQDTMQVAKVSKLLMELERGNIHLYQGKSLDEINFDLDEPLEDEADSDAEGNDRPVTEAPPTTSLNAPVNGAPNTSQKVFGNVRPKASGKRKMWTENEHAAAKRQLGKYFFIEKLPGKHEIEEARKKEPLLCNRPWIQIKSFIKNAKVSMKRKQTKSGHLFS